MFMHSPYKCNDTHIIYAQVNDQEYNLNKITGYSVPFFFSFSNVGTHTCRINVSFLVREIFDF